MRKSRNQFKNVVFSKQVKKGFFALFAMSLLLLNSCSKTDSTETSSAVPSVAVSINININSSLYNSLLTVGNAIYLTGGYRGILLYRFSTSTITAFDRTCTYDISDAGGIVYSESNGTAECADCGSVYSMYNGVVASGPTTIGLKEYTVSFNQSTGAVAITN